jgi:hypothetical protein
MPLQIQNLSYFHVQMQNIQVLHYVDSWVNNAIYLVFLLKISCIAIFQGYLKLALQEHWLLFLSHVRKLKKNRIALLHLNDSQKWLQR